MRLPHLAVRVASAAGAAAIVLGGLSVTDGRASTQTRASHLHLSHAAATPGTVVRIDGSYLPPRARFLGLYLSVGSYIGASEVTTIRRPVKVDAKGRFSLTYRLPRSLKPGYHELVLCGEGWPCTQPTTYITIVVDRSLVAPRCGDIYARYLIEVAARGVTCRQARAVVTEFYIRGNGVEHGDGTLAGSWYTLTRFPGWRCSQGSGGGGCRNGNAFVSYEVLPRTQ